MDETKPDPVMWVLHAKSACDGSENIIGVVSDYKLGLQTARHLETQFEDLTISVVGAFKVDEFPARTKLPTVSEDMG